AIVVYLHQAAVIKFAEYASFQVPFFQDSADEVNFAGLNNGQHTFLAFAKHHLVGAEVISPLWDIVQFDFNAHTTTSGHFRTGAGEARSAHILDRDAGIGVNQLEGSFQDLLFGKRITNLHGTTLGFAFFCKFRAGEGGAMDAIAPGGVAVVNNEVTNARRHGAGNFLFLNYTDAHDVYEGIAVVSR